MCKHKEFYCNICLKFSSERIKLCEDYDPESKKVLE